MPTWDILILTMPSRAKWMDRLMAMLVPQTNHAPGVSIWTRMCDPALTLGENRERLRQLSKAKYISFIDDDDLVASDYVSAIVPLLDCDYVGFNVQCTVDGVPLQPTYHSLTYKDWHSDDQGHYRDISHLNPMRRSLALLAPMEGGHGEDYRWAERMRKLGVVKTEHYIDRVMYYYEYRSNKSPKVTCVACGRDCVVRVETCYICNGCGKHFGTVPERKSCLWE